MSFFSHILPPSPVQHNGMPNAPGVPGFNAGYTGVPGMSTGAHAYGNPPMGIGGHDYAYPMAHHYNRLAMLMRGQPSGFNNRLGGLFPRPERF